MSEERYQPEFVYIHSGEIYIAGDRKPVITVLGSCISLVMYDKTTKTGGIFHAMFPENKQNDKALAKDGHSIGNADYTDSAFYRMLYHFKTMGIDPKKTELKLFGGSSSYPGTSDAQNPSAGYLNVTMIKTLLKKEGLRLLAEDTGGSVGRKLVFIPATGEVFIKHLAEKQYGNGI